MIYKTLLLGCICTAFAACEEMPEVINNIPDVGAPDIRAIEAETATLTAWSSYETNNAYFMLSDEPSMDNAKLYYASHYNCDTGGYTYYVDVEDLMPGVKYYVNFTLPNRYASDQYLETSTIDFVTDTQYRQSIIWKSWSGTAYLDGSEIKLTAYATSGLPVTYTLTENDGCVKLSGNYLVVVKSGHAVITASQDGNDEYHAANPVSKSLTVEDNKLIISDVNVSGWGTQSGSNLNGQL